MNVVVIGWQDLSNRLDGDLNDGDAKEKKIMIDETSNSGNKMERERNSKNAIGLQSAIFYLREKSDI